MSGQIVVGQLRIDLVAGTSSLTTDFKKASATAKQTAGDIKSSFDTVDFGESRAGAQLLNEELGLKMPRHLTSLISQLPGVGAAFAAALPVIAIAVFVTKLGELVEHFKKVAEEAEKAANAQIGLGTTINKTFDSLDEKLLRVGIQTDNLNGNHLAALQKQLALINKQSMSELAQSFDNIAKSAENLFKDLTVKWYQFGIGSEGAQHALKEFQTQYESLLAQGDKTGAANLLSGTLGSAKKVLDFQKQYTANQMSSNTGKGPQGQETDYSKFIEAENALKLAGVGVTDKEVKSQQALVDTLNAQLVVQTKIKTITDGEKSNARKQEENKDIFTAPSKSILSTGSSSDANGKFVSPEDTKKAADAKAAIDAANALSKAHLYDVGVQKSITDEQDKQQKNADKMADYANAAALAADIHKIKMQEAAGILTKIQADRQIIVATADSEARAEKEKGDELARQVALVKQLSDITQGGTTGSDADKKAYAKAMEDYQQFLLAKEKAKAASDARIYKSQEDETAKETAERNRAIAVMESTFNSGVMSILQGNATIGQAAEKMWSGLASNAIMAMLQMAEQELVGLALHESIALTEKELHAKNAFHGAYDATAGIPIIGPVLAPIAGATAFAAVMAFNQGGDVPGFGFGDTVPAMLSPREMVLPSNIADMVRGAANGGTNGMGQSITYAPNIAVPPGGEKQFAALLDSHFDRWTRSQARKRYTRTS